MAKIHVPIPWSCWLHVTFHCSEIAKTSDRSCHFHHMSSLGTKHCVQCYRVWIEWYHDWWWTCSIRNPALQYFHRIRMSPPSTSWFLPTIILQDSQLTSKLEIAIPKDLSIKISLKWKISEMKNIWNGKSLKWKISEMKNEVTKILLLIQGSKYTAKMMSGWMDELSIQILSKLGYTNNWWVVFCEWSFYTSGNSNFGCKKYLQILQHGMKGTTMKMRFHNKKIHYFSMMDIIHFEGKTLSSNSFK